MKRVLRLAAVLLCLALTVALGAAAHAAEAYGYTVRIYAGNRGTVDGGDVVVFRDVPYGGVVEFDLGRIQVTDAKYVVRGIRESGKDNRTVITVSEDGVATIPVTQDVDYVAAYGIPGDTVTVTIRYRDRATGEELARPSFYYGYATEKPMVHYLYIYDAERDIEYVPEARNITGTLYEDTEWTFWYNAPVAAPAATPAPRTGVTVIGGEGDRPAPTDGGVAETPAPAAPETPPPAEQGAEEEPAVPETVEILDMDTPLAEAPGGESSATDAPGDDGADTRQTTAGVLAWIGAVLALLLLLWWLLAMRRRRK